MSLRDLDWKERIVAAAENRDANMQRPRIAPYHLTVHKQPPPSQGYVIEVRPRAGSWSPFIAAIPATEKDRVLPSILHGAPGRPPSGGVLFGTGQGTSSDGQWAFCFAQNEATPTMSYYIACAELPSKFVFGTDSGVQYTVERPGS